ncbi:MAG TPA: MFS transporter [Actinomycetes bacterium]|nr:MFS transporter [Actinomycetes bacterium]
MSAMTLTSPAVVIAKPRLISGPLVRMFAIEFGALMSFYLLLPVVPQYAMAAGAGGTGAGLATGALMLSTVAAELVMPRLLARFGYRVLLAAGVLFLGVPVLALPASANLGVLVAVGLVRGIGLAIIFVACGALGAEVIPPERRGEGLGVLGIVTGLPAVVGMPLGLWLVDRAGYAPVFVLGAIVAIAGLSVVSGLPGRSRQSEPVAAMGVLAGLRNPALVRPALVFATTTVAAGAACTFLPAAVAGGSGSLAAIALLAHSVAATASRWWAGRVGDRHGAEKLVVPAVLVAALGMLALIGTASAVAVVAGMVLFGCGFGAIQNASLAVMFNRVDASGYGAASAIWSAAYDGGLGVGAVGFGMLATQVGYPAGFGATAAIMAVVLAAVALPSRSRSHR